MVDAEQVPPVHRVMTLRGSALSVIKRGGSLIPHLVTLPSPRPLDHEATRRPVPPIAAHLVGGRDRGLWRAFPLCVPTPRRFQLAGVAVHILLE